MEAKWDEMRQMLTLPEHGIPRAEWRRRFLVLGLIAADHAYSVERVRALKAAMRRRGRRRVEAIRALLRDWQVEI